MKNTGRVKWWIIGALMVGMLVLCRLPFTCGSVSAAEGTDPVTEVTYSLWTDGLTANSHYDFNDHTGTAGDPYQIESETDLAMLSLNVYNGTEYEGKYFELADDLDLSGKYWLPIGTNNGTTYYSFKGVFDGNCCKINNMTVSNTADPRVTQYAGLFGSVYGVSDRIRNLGLQNARIELDESFNGFSAGLLIGYTHNSQPHLLVEDCFAQGLISVKGKIQYVGGLLGYSHYYGATINDSYVIGDINVTGSSSMTGSVWGDYGRDANVSMNDCYAAVRIYTEGNVYAAGVGGDDNKRYYYDVSLPLNRECTGYSGIPKNTAEMKSSDMADLLNGEERNVWDQDDGLNEGYPYLIDIEPDYDVFTVTFDENGYGEAPDEQMVLSGNRLIQPTDNDGKKYIAGWYREPECTEESRWNFETDTVDEDGITLYADWKEARLWTDGMVADRGYGFSGGAGTKDDPYLLATPKDLATLTLTMYELENVSYYGRYLKLADDIDLGGLYWLPIGTNKDYKDHPFKGIFDGDGHKINNMTVSNTADPRITKYAGLFGHTQDPILEIKNIGLQNARVELDENFKGNDVGLFVGYAYNDQPHTLFDSCFAQGVISLAGTAESVGGLLGYSHYYGANVYNSYFIGEINITGHSGITGSIWGSFGRDADVILNNCYAAARISSVDSDIYALGNRETINSYYDATLPLDRDYKGINGIAKNTADMRTGSMASLLNGDEGSAWSQDEDVNEGYPYLAQVEPDYDIFTVSFDDNGYGEAPDEQMVLSGNRLIQPTDNDGKKYIAGWYRDPECTDESRWDFETDTVDEDGITLYADWKDATLWTDGMVADRGCGFSGGAGTEDDPYRLSTPKDLATLSQTLYEQGNSAYYGQYLRLANDIDLGGLYWLPIGTNMGDKDHPFKGILDGNGFKINNMTVSNKADPRITKYAGLFGHTRDPISEIKNIGLQNAKVELDENFKGNDVGLFVGYAYNDQPHTLLDSCFAQGVISLAGTAESVGGLLGYSYYYGANVYNSYFIGEINITGHSGITGSIWGSFGRDADVILNNCYAAARISSVDSDIYALGNRETINSYYDATLPLDRDYKGINGIVKNTAEMKTAAMASLLNGEEGSAWAQSDDVNTGYPYLKDVKPDYTICTVTFDRNGYGTAPAARKVFKGSRLIQSTANDGKKYIAGWYKDPGCTEDKKWNFETDTVDGSITLYADWKEATLWTDGMAADGGCGFSGGAGTEDDPFLISTTKDLATLSQTLYEHGNAAFAGQYLCLTNDIDLGGLYWLPIGTDKDNQDHPFMGIFDGNGYKINNMTVSNTADPRIIQYAGLFGEIRGKTECIKNLGLQNARIELDEKFDGYYVGLLVGYIRNESSHTVMDRCFAQGIVSLAGKATNVGGLIGYSYYYGSLVNDSYFIGDIIVKDKPLLSKNYTGSIWGGDGYDGNVTLKNSYAAAGVFTVFGDVYALGNHETENSYYDSTLPLNRDYTHVNGIAKTTAEMKTADMASILNGDMGSAWAQDDDVNAGYPYLKTVSPNCLTCTVTFDVNGYGTAMPAQEVFKGSRLIQPRDNDGQKYIDGWYRDQECTEGNEWNFETDRVEESMTLYADWKEASQWTDGLTADFRYGFSGGTGTEEDPWQIATVKDLAMLSQNLYEMVVKNGYYEKHFELQNDLDLRGANWLPIGTMKNEDWGKSFRGVFDGNGHIIKNMTVDNTKDPERIKHMAGLFSWAYSGAVIKNLGIQNGRVRIGEGYHDSDGYAALLLGYADGSTVVDSCFAQGTVTVAKDCSVKYAGGLIASSYSNPQIGNCYFLGKLDIRGSATYAGGGIGCRKDNSLKDSYVAAEFTGDGTISHPYAIVDVAENCYYDSTLNPAYTEGEGTGKSTEEMRTSAMAALLNGEGAAWAFDENVNDAYPHLAKVIPDFQKYTASFDVKGQGTAPADQILIEGSYLTEPEKPEAKGLIFDGWYRDEGFTDAWDFDKDELTSNITLISKWAAEDLTGTASITGTPKYGNTLTATLSEDSNNTGTLLYQWKRAGEEIEGADSSTYTLAADDIGKTLTVEIRSTVQAGALESEATPAVQKADGPSAPSGLSGEAPTGASGDDGRIRGTTAAMEYSSNSDFSVAADIHDCSDEATIVPHPGKWYVRIKETDTTRAGQSAEVVVPEAVIKEGLTASFILNDGSANGDHVTWNEASKRYEITYTGAKLTPAISVTNLNEPLILETDYSIKYKNNQNVSSASPAVAAISGKGSYSEKNTLEFYVVQKSLSDENGQPAEDISVGGLVIEKGGKANPVVLYKGVKLSTKDFTLTQNGDESVDITGQNNFTGTIKGLELTVVESKDEVKRASIKADLAKGVSRIYTGEPRTLTVAGDGKQGELTVTSSDGTVLDEGTDFAVSYGPNIGAGTVKVSVTGIGRYTGSVSKTFKINPAKDAKITAELVQEEGSPAGQYIFKKTGVTPRLKVTAQITDSTSGATETVTNQLTEGVDYKVSYKKNKAVSDGNSKASYSLKFLGNYKGAKLEGADTTFAIVPASLKDAEVITGEVLYNPKSVKFGKYLQKPSVVLDGILLTNKEYTVTYLDEEGKEIDPGAALNLGAEDPSVKIRVKISANPKCKNYEDTGEQAPVGEYSVLFDPNAGQAGARTDITKAKITLTDAAGKKVAKVRYTGSEITFDPSDETGDHKNQAILTVTIGNPKKGGVELKGAQVYEHFDVSYANNLNKGKGVIILTPKEGETAYAGMCTGNFTIGPASMKEDMKQVSCLSFPEG